MQQPGVAPGVVVAQPGGDTEQPFVIGRSIHAGKSNAVGNAAQGLHPFDNLAYRLLC